MIARAQWPLVVDRRVVGRVLGRVGDLRMFDSTGKQIFGGEAPADEQVFDRKAIDMAKLDAQLPLSDRGRVLLVIPVPQ